MPACASGTFLFTAVPPLILGGSPRTLPTAADEAGGTAVKFYELRDNLFLESDSAEAAAAKLEAAVSPEEQERQWLLQRLGPLVGVEAASPAERQELFTAWRRYLEGLAAARQTVLVFE